MKKITQIESFRNITKNVPDENGKVVTKQVRMKVVRPVRVVANGKRFAHFFIDGIIFNLLYFPIDKLLGYIGLEPAATVSYAFFIAIFPISIFYSLYYLLFEYFLQKTPGKIITNSIVINEYAQKPDFKQLIIRSLVRLVPFEALSCFSPRGWHDKWSDTWVVTLEENEKLQTLIRKNDPEEESSSVEKG